MTDFEYSALYQGEWAGRRPAGPFPALGRFRDRETWVREFLSPRAARLFVCRVIAINTDTGPGSSFAEEEVLRLAQGAARYAVGHSPALPHRGALGHHYVWLEGGGPNVEVTSFWTPDPYSDVARLGQHRPKLLALFGRPAGWRASWETEAVLGLAAAANADPLSPRQDLAPILADALEEAGMDGEAEEFWLPRLRSHPYPLPPGSWVLEYGRLKEGRGHDAESE